LDAGNPRTSRLETSKFDAGCGEGLVHIAQFDETDHDRQADYAHLMK
jgi:hypothetical protein